MEEKVSSSSLGERFYAKKFDSRVHVVVTSADYPFWLAVECIDELSATTSTSYEAMFDKVWHTQEDRDRKRLQQCIHLLVKYSHDEPGCVLYDMRIMADEEEEEKKDNDIVVPYSLEHLQRKKEYMQVVDQYLENREEQIIDTKVHDALDQVEDIKNQMLATVVMTQSNMIHAIKLKEDADELLKQALIFRKSAAQLRKKVHRTHPLALLVGTTVVIASAGSAIALAAGAEGIGLLAGAMIGGVFGYHVADTDTAEWFYSLPRIFLTMWSTE